MCYPLASQKFCQISSLHWIKPSFCEIASCRICLWQLVEEVGQELWYKVGPRLLLFPQWPGVFYFSRSSQKCSHNILLQLTILSRMSSLNLDILHPQSDIKEISLISELCQLNFSWWCLIFSTFKASLEVKIPLFPKKEICNFKFSLSCFPACGKSLILVKEVASLMIVLGMLMEVYSSSFFCWSFTIHEEEKDLKCKKIAFLYTP